MNNIDHAIEALKQWSQSRELVNYAKQSCYTVVHQLNWNHPFFENLSPQQRQNAPSTLNIELQRQSLEFLQYSTQIDIYLDVCFWGQENNHFISRDNECQFNSTFDFDQSIVTHKLLWGKDEQVLFKNCISMPPTDISTLKQSLTLLEKWTKTHHPIQQAKMMSLSSFNQWYTTTTCPRTARKKLFGKYFIDELTLKTTEASLTYEHNLVHFPYIAVLLKTYAPTQDQIDLGDSFYLAHIDGSVLEFYFDFKTTEELLD